MFPSFFINNIDFVATLEPWLLSAGLSLRSTWNPPPIREDQGLTARLQVNSTVFICDRKLFCVWRDVTPPQKKMSEWWRYTHAWNKFKMIILSRRRISVRQVQVSGAWPAAARAVCSVLIARAAGDVKELEDAVLLWRFGAEDRTAAEPLRTEMRQSTVNCFFWIQFVWSAVAHGDSLSLFHSLTHTRGLRLTEFSILHHFILLI